MAKLTDLRSFGQISRHADARKAKNDRSALANLLARHEAALKIMLGEVRAALDNVEGGKFARESLRYNLRMDKPEKGK
jgi:hypothetical protein